MPISGPQYIEALGLVPWDTEAGDGLLCRSIYGNYIGGGGEFCSCNLPGIPREYMSERGKLQDFADVDRA